MTFLISTTADGIIRLAVKGEWNGLTDTELQRDIEKLLAQRPGRVEVDLSLLRLLDTSGAGVLVSLYKRVRAHGGEMIVSGLRDQPLAVFRSLRMARLLPPGGTRGRGGGGAAPAEIATPLPRQRKRQG